MASLLLVGSVTTITIIWHALTMKLGMLYQQFNNIHTLCILFQNPHYLKLHGQQIHNLTPAIDLFICIPDTALGFVEYFD